MQTGQTKTFSWKLDFVTFICRIKHKTVHDIYRYPIRFNNKSRLWCSHMHTHTHTNHEMKFS